MYGSTPPPPPGTNPDSHTSQVDAIYGVQNCIKDFGTWMEVDSWILV